MNWISDVFDLIFRNTIAALVKHRLNKIVVVIFDRVGVLTWLCPDDLGVYYIFSFTSGVYYWFRWSGRGWGLSVKNNLEFHMAAVRKRGGQRVRVGWLRRAARAPTAASAGFTYENFPNNMRSRAGKMPIFQSAKWNLRKPRANTNAPAKRRTPAAHHPADRLRVWSKV